MSIVEQLQQWVITQTGPTVYGALALMLLAGAFGLPIPEDLPLILGGILVQMEKCDPVLVFVVCYVAIVFGDVIIFWIGRWSGPALFKLKWFSSRSARTKLKRARLGLERRSILTVFLARHIFYLRTVTFLSCGALNMRFLRFLAADMVAALISVPMMLLVGYYAASHYDSAMHLLGEAKFVAIGAGLLAALWWLRRRRLAAMEPDSDSRDASVA